MREQLHQVVIPGSARSAVSADSGRPKFGRFSRSRPIPAKTGPEAAEQARAPRRCAATAQELFFVDALDRLWLGPSSKRTLLGALVAAQVAAL